MCTVMLEKVREFRDTVSSESNRLSTFCTTWRAVIEKDSGGPNKTLAEDIVGDINVAIGQAELLMRQRFHQFNGLIDNCEFNTGEKLTTVQDLQGFWDIISIQVEDITKKFNLLDELRSNNWQKVQPLLPVIPIKRPVPVKKAVAPKSAAPRPAASSSIRAHILAARNKLNKLALEDSAPAPQQPNTGPCALQENSSNTTIISRSTPTKARPAPRNKENIDTSGQTEAKSASKARNGSGGGDEAEHKASDDDTPSDRHLSPVVNQSPQLSIFDAGFFKIQTPCKTKRVRKEPTVNPQTPVRSRSAHGETRVLASAMLKERVLRTPMAHKDYSPCMRITRSMKKLPRRRQSSPDQSPQ